MKFCDKCSRHLTIATGSESALYCVPAVVPITPLLQIFSSPCSIKRMCKSVWTVDGQVHNELKFSCACGIKQLN